MTPDTHRDTKTIETDSSKHEPIRETRASTERSKPSGSDARTADIGQRGAGGSRDASGPRDASGSRDAGSGSEESKSPNRSPTGETPANSGEARYGLSRAVGRAMAAVRRHPARAVIGAFTLGWISGRGMPKILARAAVALALRAAVDEFLEARVTPS